MKYGKCPRCNSNKVVFMIYGYPTVDLFVKERRGEIKISGCIVMPYK